jgi:hypothetical protein
LLKSLRRAVAVAAAAALVVLGPAAARPAAAESEAAAGKPGYCSDESGVTVVVDFRELGGDVVVRCATGPGGQGYTGLEALTDAGFTVAGTLRWGMQFVCRIQGRPAAREDLAIPGDDSYHEDCGDTPPDTAYWSYWYASNGGDWKYSTASAATRSTLKGGFEGCSFHLGTSSATPPPIAPKHSVEAPTSSAPTQPAGGGRHGGQQGGRHGGAQGGSDPTPPTPEAATTSSATGSTSTPPNRSGGGHDGQAGGDGSKPDATSDPPPAATSTGPETDGPQITTALPDEPDTGGGGSAAPFLIGAGVLVLLGAGAGATAWRRSHRG